MPASSSTVSVFGPDHNSPRPFLVPHLADVLRVAHHDLVLLARDAAYENLAALGDNDADLSHGISFLFIGDLMSLRRTARRALSAEPRVRRGMLARDAPIATLRQAELIVGVRRVAHGYSRVTARSRR